MSSTFYGIPVSEALRQEADELRNQKPQHLKRDYLDGVTALMAQAADEIERLQARVEELEKQILDTRLPALDGLREVRQEARIAILEAKIDEEAAMRAWLSRYDSEAIQVEAQRNCLAEWVSR